MESMPDHILLAIFKPSLIQDRMLTFPLVCNRWRNLASYNLVEDSGPRLDVGYFERISIVGVRNRNDRESRFVETSEFLSRLFKFLFASSSEKDCFRKIAFTTSREIASFPEWSLDDGLMQTILDHCPNLVEFDFGYAQLESEAMMKLLQFKNLKNLSIKRLDQTSAFVLELLQLESLKISGKQAPLSHLICTNLRSLRIESPVPSAYFDLLTTLTQSAPNLERISRVAINNNNNDPEPFPGDVLAQIRAHQRLKSVDDRSFFLNDDNGLIQLIESKQQQFERLRIYSEDGLRLSLLGQPIMMEKLRRLSIDGKNLEPDELAAVFLIPTLETLSISWTFKDDRTCSLDLLQQPSTPPQKMMDIRCANLRRLYLHLDFLSVNGRAWGKNTIVNVLQQCPRLTRIDNSDWLLAPDYVELREAERFVEVIGKIDININCAMDLFQVLNLLTIQDDDNTLTFDPISWPNVRELSVFINEDYYVCDLSCINGATLPRLRKLEIRSDNDVFFERFCDVQSLHELRRIDGKLRFENVDAELDWLDQVGEHRRFEWLSTIQTTLTPSLFCDILMRARARLRESGYEAPATVVYVSTVGGVSARRLVVRSTSDNDLGKWDEVARILYTSRIMARSLCN